VFRTIDLGARIRSPQGWEYELSAPAQGDFLLGDGFVFGIGWFFSDQDSLMSSGAMTQQHYLEGFNQRQAGLPMLAKVHFNQSNMPSITLGLDSFYAKQASDNVIRRTSEPTHYCRLPENNYFFSWFGPGIFEIDPSTLDFSRVADVTYKGHLVGALAPTVRGSMDDSDPGNSGMPPFDHIVCMGTDIRTGHHFVSVALGATVGPDLAKLPFALVEFDQHWQLIRDHPCTDGTYFGAGLLTTAQGLYVQRKSPNYANGKAHTFDRIAL